MDFTNYSFSAVDRFMRYAAIDTQSDPKSTSYPSTEKQKDLGRLLVMELRELGIDDAHMDEHGLVYGTLKSNSDKKVPTICFCSHMDTAPDAPGKDVKPLIHKNYDGNPIVLPDNPAIVIDPAEHPELKKKVGMDVITASGNTLLGADNKAGVAEIMDAVKYLLEHPEIKHGDIRILFTCDEETGRGTEKVDMDKLGADFGYTVDGERLGSLEDETFSADAVKVTFKGLPIHPGFAKGKLVNGIKVAAHFIELLPKDTLSPETTEGREGFVHPTDINGIMDNTVVEFIIRDFTAEKLHEKEDFLDKLAQRACDAYPGSKYDFEVIEQYRNMKEVLDKHPMVTALAKEAMEDAGLTIYKESIRGGTDGSKFSFMGMPCPNIFAGEYSFHSRKEWACVQDMQKAVEVIVRIAAKWESKEGKLVA
jgi:tripeptide aminopeptidase